MDDHIEVVTPAPAGGSVADMLDARRLSPLQLSVVALVASILVLEGLSLQVLAYVTPSILTEWRVTKIEFAPAVGVTKFGMAAGALIGAKFGDWWGRKPIIVGAALLFSISTIACAAADSVTTLAALRLVTGLAFGASFPNAVALVAEWMPRRTISQAIGVMTAGIPVGGMIGAIITMLVLDRWGWQGCFVVGGGLPLALAMALVWWMPESPAWISRRGSSARLKALLARAWPIEDRNWAPSSTNADVAPMPRESGIFTRSNVRTNVALWLGFFMNGFAVNGLLLWGTTALTTMGVGLQTAIGLGVPYNIASIAFTVGAGVIAARAGTKKVLLVLSTITFFALMMSAALATGTLTSPLGIGALYVAAGGCMGGIQALLIVMATHAYPIASRSMGVGVSSAVGRVSGILSGFVGGAILSVAPPSVFFALLSGTALLIVVSALLAERHVARRAVAG